MFILTPRTADAWKTTPGMRLTIWIERGFLYEVLKWIHSCGLLLEYVMLLYSTVWMLFNSSTNTLYVLGWWPLFLEDDYNWPVLSYNNINFMMVTHRSELFWSCFDFASTLTSSCGCAYSQSRIRIWRELTEWGNTINPYWPCPLARLPTAHDLTWPLSQPLICESRRSKRAEILVVFWGWLYDIWLFIF